MTAKGSHKTWGELSSRVCCVCGNRLTLKDATAQHTAYPDSRPVSWSHHIACAAHVPLKKAQATA